MKNEKQELNEKDLESITGGVVNANWDAESKIGTVTSNQVSGTFHFSAEHCADVAGFVYKDAQDYTDADAIEHMKSKGWIE